MSFIQNNISSIIQTQTVSGAASVNFTNLNNSGFNNFSLVLTNIVESGNNSIFLRISTNGSTYIATGYTAGMVYTISGASAWINVTATTGFPVFVAGGAGANGESTVNILNLTSGTNYVSCTGNSLLWLSPNFYNSFFNGIYNTVSTPCVAFQLIPSAGTVSGTFKLYGYL